MIVTESDLRANWAKEKQTVLEIPQGSVITPSAREFIRNKGICVKIGGKGIIDFTNQTYNAAVHSKPEEPEKAQSSREAEKPEYMTHLNGKKLVVKSDPVIRLRGELDSFITQLVETQIWFISKGGTGMAEKLEEVLVFCRGLMQAEVLERKFVFPTVFGLNKEQIREVSHNPMKYFGINHSHVSKAHGMSVAKLQVLRAKSREVELAAVDAFVAPEGQCSREDIVSALNRLSSILYILICLEKVREQETGVVYGDDKVRRFEVNIGVSNRHIHLNQADLEALYGTGYQLRKMRNLSQPGQFAAVETLDVIGPKGKLERVRILGPVRDESQVEISVSDSKKLGIDPPVRESGDIDSTPGIVLASPIGKLELKKGVIIAKRHLHLDPAAAAEMGLEDKDVITAYLKTERPIRLENIGVRVSEEYATDLHIDMDEANAALAKNGDKAILILEA
ncbi:MAG TPA: phosphate propanoyltransferase [Anaerovoracaceae bacterium]|nr:phosphate propanoyltransferase [Anaerovoracaceae bacterium]